MIESVMTTSFFAPGDLKRYYTYDDDAIDCWNKCTYLQNLLNPAWLTQQAKHQLLWEAHPLFFDICLNQPAVFAFDKALEFCDQEHCRRIKRKLKKLSKCTAGRGEWFSFLAEIFMLLRLTKRNIDYNYRPEGEGADFILPKLSELQIEVTSIQPPISIDGHNSAWDRWQYSLHSFKRGLYLKLICSKRLEELTRDDWLDAFDHFEKLLRVRKSYDKDDELTLRNREEKVLVKFSVKAPNPGFKNPIVCKPPVIYSGNFNKMYDDFLNKMFKRIKNKQKQISEGNLLVCLDVTRWNWNYRGVWQAPPSDVKESIIKETRNWLSQSGYSSIVGFVIFERDLENKDISTLCVIPNDNSTLATNSPKSFDEVLRVFSS